MADEVSQEERETTEPWQQNESHSAQLKVSKSQKDFFLSSIPPKKNIFSLSIIALASKK